MEQGDLGLPEWGGKRKRAGRKRGRNTSHVGRERVSRHAPMHVTMRLARGLPSLRKKDRFIVVKAAMELASKRPGFAVIHYSVQHNHLHLMIEAADNKTLARGMQSLSVRIARNLNKLLRRKGTVFSDRYHLRVLKTPTETRLCLLYILNNSKKHAKQDGVPLAPSWVDPFSSASRFDGWLNFPSRYATYGIEPAELPGARSYLLNHAWRKRGLLDIRRVPGKRR
jgi:REP element-mobilizing transposase RayT